MENIQDRGVWLRIQVVLRGWIRIRIRFVLRGWIRIRIRFVPRGWIRIRSISDRICNPCDKNERLLLKRQYANFSQFIYIDLYTKMRLINRILSKLNCAVSSDQMNIFGHFQPKIMHFEAHKHLISEKTVKFSEISHIFWHQTVLW